jgi:OHCU decarboxylase
VTLGQLNRLSRSGAVELFLSCCGARAWAEGMTQARPYATREELFSEAEQLWRSLPRASWLEAFDAHPRIGERAAGQAAREQARARGASPETLAALAEANRVYEARFGRVFLVFASGKSAEEMLAICRARLHNDPETELSVAAAEQEKITRLRLEKLFMG